MKKVVIGMSGGVDSSVAAYLLKRQGYEVIGISFKFIDEFDDSDAKKVADKLGIEFHTIDYRDKFKELVIDRFISDYESGLTPNPCSICNKVAKMQFLYDQMLELNADFIATGHYAKNDGGKLYRSADLFKDQTYFLSSVPSKIINVTLFPLEGLEKEDVRHIAGEIGLEVYNKKDSTDVCFISNTFKDYMRDSAKLVKGNIIDLETNKVIGEHVGLPLYTIGQRKGLNIGGTENRLFVVGKNIKENILYVAESDNNDYLMSDECIIDNVNLISIHHPTFCTAKFRYHSKDVPVSLEYLENNEIRVKYSGEASSVTPGQTCALYLGNECIGSGIIRKVLKNNEELWYL